MSAICFTCLRADDSLRYMMKNDALILELLLSPKVNVAHPCFANTLLHLCDRCMRMLDCISVFRSVATKSVHSQILYWNENKKKDKNDECVDTQVESEIPNDQLTPTVESIKQEPVIADDEMEESGENMTSDIKIENDVLPNNTDIENEHLLDEHLLDIKPESDEKTFNAEVENDMDGNEKEQLLDPSPDIQDASSNIEADNVHALPESPQETELIIKQKNTLPNKAKNISYLEEQVEKSCEPEMCNIGVKTHPQNPNGSLVGRLLGRMLAISPYFNRGIPTSEPICEDSGNESPEPEIQAEEPLEKKQIPRKVKEVKKLFHRVQLKKAEIKTFRERQKFKEPFRSAQYKCAPCLKVFETARLLENHLCKMHSLTSGYATCPVCSRTMPPGALKSHRTRHRSIYSCVLCGRSAPDVWSVRRHRCPRAAPKRTL